MRRVRHPLTLRRLAKFSTMLLRHPPPCTDQTQSTPVFVRKRSSLSTCDSSPLFLNRFNATLEAKPTRSLTSVGHVSAPMTLASTKMIGLVPSDELSFDDERFFLGRGLVDDSSDHPQLFSDARMQRVTTLVSDPFHGPLAHVEWAIIKRPIDVNVPDHSQV
jgi:hypothetical protein